jgi:hypothetical protein
VGERVASIFDHVRHCHLSYAPAKRKTAPLETSGSLVGELQQKVIWRQAPRIYKNEDRTFKDGPRVHFEDTAREYIDYINYYALAPPSSSGSFRGYQQGRYVGEVLATRTRGDPAPPPFRYRDRGTLATIGRHSAIADLRWIRLTG